MGVDASLTGATFFVAGATGRLGCEVTARLEDLGAGVLPAVLPGYPPEPKRVPWEASTRPIIVSSPEDLASLPAPDFAINLHWVVDRTRPFAEQLASEVERNVACLSYVWQWLCEQSVTAFANCSSIRLFSHLNANPISAATEPRPVSPYGIAKLAAEKYFTALFANGATAVCHLRLSSVYSHGEHPSQLVSRLAASALDRRHIKINAGHRVHLLHIDEAVDAIISAAVLARVGPLLLTPPAMPIERVAEVFAAVAGAELDAELIDLEPGMPDPEFVSDLDGLRSPWTRVVTIEQGLGEVIERRRGAEPAAG